ncbi:D(2) dopamine receptor-like [Patiria miniata]|uniref:G-protein coupled receptors family 1 profile domain-containing protein n=1 Tax=Patiria miniata TaxID=46514 RepID=A0A913ZSB2_PATMI|nr:D(2) dopamine receptor-like [Patiria miniata]
MESTWNSSELSEDTSTSTKPFDIFHVIANSILFLFGVPGNCLILRVYWTKSHKTSTHVLIMALAWADLVVCLLRSTAIVQRILELIGAGEQAALVFYLWPVESIAIGTSIVITTIIAADRYDCICRPQRRYFTPRRGKIAVGVGLVISFGTSIPAFLRITDFYSPVLFKLQMAFQTVAFAIALVAIAVCYGKVYATIRRHVRVGAVLRPTRSDEGSSTQVPHTTIAVSISNVDEAMSTFANQPSSSQASPGVKMTKLANAENDSHMPTQTVPNLLKLRQPQHPMRRDVPLEADVRASFGNRDNNQAPRPADNGNGHAPQRVGAAVLQRKTTRMLFITSVVFLLTWTPYFIWFGMGLAEYAGVVLDDISRYISQELLVAVYINNAVNPLIYGLANRRFRQDCKAVLSKSKLCTVWSPNN